MVIKAIFILLLVILDLVAGNEAEGKDTERLWYHWKGAKDPPIHPREPTQYYRWYPHPNPLQNSDPYHWTHFETLLPKIHSTISTALSTTSNETLCTVPAFESWTGHDPTFAFLPRGYRVSKVFAYKEGISIRLINYRSWFYPEHKQTLKLFCRSVLDIAGGLAKAMEVDISLLKMSGGRSYSNASWYEEAEMYGNEEYRLLGTSWWGRDWSWAVSLGWEEKVPGEGGWVQEVAVSSGDIVKGNGTEKLGISGSAPGEIRSCFNDKIELCS